MGQKAKVLPSPSPCPVRSMAANPEKVLVSPVALASTPPTCGKRATTSPRPPTAMTLYTTQSRMPR